MPHPLDNDRINVPLHVEPLNGDIFLNLAHWMRYQWAQCPELTCEIPVDTCADNNFVFESGQEFIDLNCDDPFPRPYVVIEDFGFVPSRPGVPALKCTTGSNQLTYRVYHQCSAMSQALSQTFWCKLEQVMGRRLDTQLLVYSRMADLGFTKPQKTRRSMYMSSQSIRWHACRVRNAILSDCN